MKALSIIIFFAISTSSIATERWHTSTIKALYPLSGGNFVIVFDADHPDCSNTGAPKYHYVNLGENQVSQAALDKIYAAALAAGMARKTVSIAFDDSNPACYINRLWLEFN